MPSFFTRLALPWALALCGVAALAGADSLPAIAIGHMANHPSAVQWYADQGMNGVEVDLQFDPVTGSLSRFQHSTSSLEMCDCSCVCALGNTCFSHHVCRQLWDATGSHCTAQSDPATLVAAVVNRTADLRLLYLDSKVQGLPRDVLAAAGRAVVAFMDAAAFGAGYTGQVLVSAPALDRSPYIEGAVAAAAASPNAARYFFTYDEENSMVRAMQALGRLTPNRVYSSGTTSCAPWLGTGGSTDPVVSGTMSASLAWTRDVTTEIQTALGGVANGVLRGPYANGVLTNIPEHALTAFAALGRTPSKGLLLAPATAPVPCDCDYHPGGCSISFPARNGSACQCSYKGAWTCGGSEVPCSDPSDPRCAAPDFSLRSCLLGGGDCGGYSGGDNVCDCSYRTGGCVVTTLPQPGLACKCSYTGAWTCGGTVTRCADPASPACKSPAFTPATCVQGSGDCGGYKTWAACDCDYHRGGCAVSRAAAPYTACKCSYKGF